MVSIGELKKQINRCMLKDRFPLRRALQQQFKHKDSAKLAQLAEKVAVSCQQVATRQAGLPKPEYDDALPIAQKREEIAKAIEANQVVVIAGETGSGKTTQLPKICLELGRGVYGTIGHTQPRRLAARSVASRISEELNSELGQQVGYQVRFTDQVSDNTLIKLMTDGILLAEIQQDRFLNQYDTLIIDEAHERSLNIDFLLGYLKHILPKRPDLKLIITSATIDVERFSRHFDNAPVIEVSGRTYPVEVYYRPLTELNEDDEEASKEQDISIQQGIANVLTEIEHQERQEKYVGSNDVLVFLSGEWEIRETAHFLRKCQFRDTEILPLYARLSAAEQQRIFQSHRGRRVILATNVAETSLTVPGIKYVIDPGFARISRYSYRSKVQRLPIEAVSQASANQRKGRCGRVSDGVCFRLYSEEDFLGRPEFTDAEILRTNLAAVILQMLKLRLGEITDFPFVDPPDSRFIKDGFRLLHELGAVTQQNKLTPVGHQLSQLPIDPRLGRMLLAAGEIRALNEVLVVVSALGVQDPRERPVEKQQAADQAHNEFKDDDSDFMSVLNLWQFYEEQRQELSQSQLRKLCKKRFLSFMRMREWRDLHRQLMLACKQLNLPFNQEPAAYASIHQSLLAGLLSHLGNKTEQSEYLGARNKKFHIFPGSALFKKQPKWLITAELVETSKLYARMNAKIDPVWVEPFAKHLVKIQHFEPHWEKRRQQVVGFEQVSLFGLVIVPKRKVDFGKIDPDAAREIFIQSALVEGELHTKGQFFQHNLQLLEAVDELEAKARRRDILVEPEVLAAFYRERIPLWVHSGRQFEQWRQKAEKNNPQLLWLTKEYLMQHDAAHITEEAFPDQFEWQGISLPLSYQFDPAREDDGVSIAVPVSLLRQLPKYRLEWLVPGLLYDKCVALVRALPKAVRKNFVPVPDYVKAALEQMTPSDEPLTQLLGERLFRMAGSRIAAESWQLANLDPHFLMNIKVLTDDGKLLGEGRDLIELQQRFADQLESGVQQVADSNFERTGLIEWDFAEIPPLLEQQRGSVVIKAYPALIDEGKTVGLTLFSSASWASHMFQQGLTRLAVLRLAGQLNYFAKSTPDWRQLAMYAVNLLNKQELQTELQYAAVKACLPEDSKNWPRDAVAFEQWVQQVKQELEGCFKQITDCVTTVLDLYQQIQRRLKGTIQLSMARSLADVKAQLQQLVYKGFIKDTPLVRLLEYPRYLQAILIRLDKLGQQQAKDRASTEELQNLWDQYLQKSDDLSSQKIINPELEEYRWLLEEYRVSLFAQVLKTKVPISAKRLRKHWELVCS
ncbi:ATP-dependent RNA helicase HrpA [Spartinivicinus marinus]|nr:ATP-dependent RNA helicase HrpA [Spartinivicinus marinus]